ncbi:MAG: hypothetical protein V3V61_00235 [Gammaproteobacteria bacterium]
MNALTIKNTETFTDNAEVVDIFGQGCNYATDKGVEGFEVQFDVVALNNGEERKFHVVYQSTDRSDNIMAYSGVEMSTASRYGCDADESEELLEFMDDDDGMFGAMEKQAQKLCAEWLNERV